MLGVSRTKALLLASVAGPALLAAATVAQAGGFAIREQSAEFQGMSYAGAAAGGSLSSIFWNSAATASRDGLNTESSYALIVPGSEVTVTNVNSSALAGGALQGFFRAAPAQADGIGPTAVVPASYGTYQISQNVFLGIAVNAPFGLTTEPNNYNYQGSVIAQTTKLTTYNFNPTIAVRVGGGFTIGAGLQAQSAEGTFRFATGTPIAGVPGNPFAGQTTSVEGNGWGFGGTAGIIWEPTASTRLGVGYRSQIDQPIDGYIYTGNFQLGQKTTTTANLPDIVTASFRQVVSPVLRVDGTFEWTNWSRFKNLTVTSTENGANVLTPRGNVAGTTFAVLPFNWSDGYFYSAGVEYDYKPNLTARMGFAYEKSPIDSPEKRSTGIPDNNRYWLSFGLTYRWTEATTFDVGYSHLFVEDATFSRTSLAGVQVNGTVESKIDIVSLGLKTRW